MELGRINGNNALKGVNFKGTEETTMSEYKPQGRCLAERELTNLVHVDNYITSLRGLSNSGLPSDPKFDFYIQEHYDHKILDRNGHKCPAVSSLEVVNQKTKQPRLLVRYIGENPVLKTEYNDKTGKPIKKTEFYGTSGNGMVYYYDENGKHVREENLK